MSNRTRNTSVRKPIWRTHASVHTKFAKNKIGLCCVWWSNEIGRKEREIQMWRYAVVRFCFFINLFPILYDIIAIAVIIDVVTVTVRYCPNFFSGRSHSTLALHVYAFFSKWFRHYSTWFAWSIACLLLQSRLAINLFGTSCKMHMNTFEYLHETLFR